MSEMIERIAWAIERAEEDFSGDVIVGRQFVRSPRPESMAMARAAIEAMREPTRGMTAAGYDAGGVSPSDVGPTWGAMIAAALRGDDWWEVLGVTSQRGHEWPEKYMIRSMTDPSWVEPISNLLDPERVKSLYVGQIFQIRGASISAMKKSAQLHNPDGWRGGA